MSNVHTPSDWCATSVARRDSGTRASTGSASEHRIAREIEPREDVAQHPAGEQAHVDVSRLRPPVAGGGGARPNRRELALAARVGGQPSPATKRLPRVPISVIGLRRRTVRPRRPATARPARRAAVRPRRRSTRTRRRMRSPGVAGPVICPRRGSVARPKWKNGPTVCDDVATRPSFDVVTRAPRTAWSRGRAPRCRTGSRAPTPAVSGRGRTTTPCAACARSSGIDCSIGSYGNSGSLGKYICVTRRVRNDRPKIEK